MTALVFKLTDAGRAAFVNPSNTGTAARTVVSVGITATAFAPTAALAAVPNEIKRLATISGAAVGDDTVHITIRDESTDVYSARGFGLYLDNGVLLGTYSQPAVIVEKSAGALMLLSTDLRFIDSAVPANAIQFGNADFMNPPATTQTPGVVELATADEAVAGTDGSRAVTPLALAAVANLLMQAISTRAAWGTTLAAYRINDAYTAAAVDQLLSGKADKGTTLGAYGINDAYTKTAVDQALAGKAAKGTTLAAYGITDAAPAAHVGATGNAHGAATQAVSGFMSAADKTKLDAIQAGAQVNAVTSVAGRTGAVVLGKADVGLGNVDNTADVQKYVARAALADAATVAGSAATLSPRSDVPLSQVDNATISGFHFLADNDASELAIVANVGGSVGTLQQRFSFLGGFWYRNKTDNNAWTPWKLVLTDKNIGDYALLRSGGTTTGDIAVRRTGKGGVTLFTPTSDGYSGSVLFIGQNGIRQGFIGSSPTEAATDDGGAIAYRGARHEFTGAMTRNGKNLVDTSEFGVFLGTSGYQKLPSGLIVQWGTYSGLSGGENTVFWPMTFPNLCFGGVASYAYAFSTNSDAGLGLSAVYTTSGKIRTALGGATAFVIVLGY